MCKRIFATALAMLLLVASIGYAANMQVNSSASPASGGTILPNGIKFFGPASTDAQRTYTVANKPGWALVKVEIDGVDAGVGPYVVPFDTSKVHTIKASFNQASTTFSLTATAGAGGTAIITGGGATGIKATDTRHVVVGPNTGYSIASVLVDGVAVPAAAGSLVAYTVDFLPASWTKNHTVAATFAVAPTATVTAGGNKSASAFPFSSAFSTTLTGSATSNVNPIAYQWNLVSGPAAATFGTATAATTTFNGTEIGQYVVTLTANGVVSAPATITIIGSGTAASSACVGCHAGTAAVTNYPTSIHAEGSTHSSCAACHNSTTVTANDTHNGNNINTRTVDAAKFTTMTTGIGGLGKGAIVCTLCHNGGFAIPHPTNLNAGVTCAACHTDSLGQNTGTGDAHSIKGLPRCIDCHAVAQAQVAPGLVNDNNGVRSIVPEFGKTSHHVVGKTLSDADCAVCHLEGTVSNGAVVVDATKHMVDNKIHLRNGNTAIQSAAAEYTWDPASPDHTAMDQFCMSCHNANGAASVPAALFTVLGNGASATNPFGDAIRNDYDMMARSVVTPVYDQFDTGNSSHHAVRGQKYSGRTRAQAEANYPGAFTQYSGAAVNPRSSGADTNANAGIGPMSPGSRYTIYEAGYFVSNYTPLGANQTVADDSTLHCGDCHTVGQWKVGSTTGVTANSDGTTTVTTGLAAIGAHGSINEYMLRTSDGVDALHHQSTNVVADSGTLGQGFVPPTDGTYVCFLCHSQRVYGAEEYLPYKANPPAGITFAAGRLGGHGGMHPCNDDVHGESVGLTGSARVASHEDGEWGGGNLYGYTCGHCHNAGNKGFGGIHGGNAVWGTYSASQGYASATHNTPTITYRKSYRFMGGLSLRYNGGATAAKWESQTLQKSNREGCYNFTAARPTTGVATGTARSALTAAKNEWAVDSAGQATEFTDGTTANAMYGTWGACSHHNGTSTAGSGNTANRKVQRPLQY